MWLCGIPSNGAGANDAKDWTNADGSWDYTRKPQVEGDVIWNGEFTVTLDNAGNRSYQAMVYQIIQQEFFQYNPGTIPYLYDRNPNIISVQPLSICI